MSNFIKSYGFKLLAVLTCPLLAIIAIFSVTLGAFLNSPIITRFGMRTLYGGMLIMLPLGIICAILSWRMARAQAETASDSRDLVEFLLGFGAFVMIVLGAFLSPLAWRFADYF